MKRILLLVVLSAVLLSLWGCNGKHAARPFITKWQGTAGQELKIPILGTYTLTWYNATTPDDRHTEQVTVTSYIGKFDFEETSPYSLTPPTDGVYVVEAGPEGVEGMLMEFDSHYDYANALISVVQFGDVVWKQLHNAFSWCVNMRFEEGIDTPNLSQCTSLEMMFRRCTTFNSSLAKWDVSKITNMNSMFEGCETFNQTLESWDVSHVTDMSRMFAECRSFNQPLEKWDVSNVNKMEGLFSNCVAFNQPLEKWDVSQVTDIFGMFQGCSRFNQPLEQWNVARVTNMSFLFYNCGAFNQSLEAWKVNPLAHAEGMEAMFVGTPAAELPFIAKWRAAGCQLDEVEVEELIDEEYLGNELEEQ